MTKDEMIKEVSAMKPTIKDDKMIVAIAKELGIELQVKNCIKCTRDHLNIVKEALGMIEDASEVSDFNSNGSKYTYIVDRPQTWKGHVIDQNTPVEVIEQFMKVVSHPEHYYRLNDK